MDSESSARANNDTDDEYKYRLNFTHPEFDISAIEEVRLHFLVIANGLPNSIQLQNCVVVSQELDRLLKLYINVFNYHIPRIAKSEEGTTGPAGGDLQDRESMIKVGFAGLANLAGHSEFIGLRMVETSEFIEEMLKYWFSSEKRFREESILTLRNLSANGNGKVAEALVEKYPTIVGEAIKIISSCPKEPVADDLVRFLANMVQIPLTCSLLIEKDLIVKLLPFLKEDFAKERRRFISHILKTCFRDNDDGVKFLMDSDSEMLSYLLLPLAGGEEFTEEEYEAMPVDLQYLPSTKVRDPDPEVRYNLVSCICHLSRTKPAREIMRSSNAYLILRELHKFEDSHPEGLAQTVELIEDWVSHVILTEEYEHPS